MEDPTEAIDIPSKREFGQDLVSKERDSILENQVPRQPSASKLVDGSF